MDGVDAVRHVILNNIEGCLVECGVDAGHFEYVWIKELQQHNQVRDIYMYDTFGGLTEPGDYDYTRDTTGFYTMSKEEVHKEWEKHIINDKTNGWCYTPLDKVRERLNSTGYPQDKLHYMVGDVMETLTDSENIPEKIAILRLDTDWYESSKIELERMYDNVVKGGVIIFDDYYHWEGQRKATDDFFADRNLSYHFFNIGNGKTAAIIKK